MDPAPPNDWISSVTRSLRDNPELELNARRELTERATHADPAQLAAIQSRFDEIDRRPPKFHRLLYWLPIALALVLTLVGAVFAFFHFRDIRNFTRGMWGGPGFFDPSEKAIASLSPEDQFFIVGDTSQHHPKFAFKALWQSQPENPALFNRYLNYCNPLPSDFLETAERIDPDNGWFLLIAAGELADESVARKYRSTPGPYVPSHTRPYLHDWIIKDPAKLEETMNLIKEALAKPRFEHYGSILLRERIALLPPEKDFNSRNARLWHAFSGTSADVFHAMTAARALAAHAYTLGMDGDKEGIRELIPLADELCRRLVEEDGTLTVHIIAQTSSLSIYEHLLEACTANGMSAEAARLEPIVLGIRDVRRRHYEARTSEPNLIHKHGSFTSIVLSSYNQGLTSNPPTLDDLKPGRMMNYALLDRLFLWLGATFLLLCLLPTLLLPIAHFIVAMIVAGFIRWFVGSDVPTITAISIGSLGILGLLPAAFRSIFGHHDHSPYRAAVARVLSPALAFNILVLLTLIPLTHLSERYWISKDEFLRTSPETYGLGRMERETAQALQAELRKALNASP